jgi:hypothetical protein
MESLRNELSLYLSKSSLAKARSNRVFAQVEIERDSELRIDSKRRSDSSKTPEDLQYSALQPDLNASIRVYFHFNLLKVS